jgi:hypothetical protein
MTQHGTDDEEDAPVALPAGEESRESVEVYESEEGTVFYDAQNPLAWLQSTGAVPLTEQV